MKLTFKLLRGMAVVLRRCNTPGGYAEVELEIRQSDTVKQNRMKLDFNLSGYMITDMKVKNLYLS